MRLGPWLRVMGARALVMGGQFLRAGLMMLANPMVLAIVLIIAALAVAGYMIWKHWGTIKGAFASGMAYLGGLWDSFKSFGSHLIQGLIDGVSAKISALKATILGVGIKAVGWFKNLLGIKSPSRVFMGLGGFITDGLAIGLERGSKQPVARMAAIAGAMSGALAGAAPPAMQLRAPSPPIMQLAQATPAPLVGPRPRAERDDSGVGDLPAIARTELLQPRAVPVLSQRAEPDAEPGRARRQAQPAPAPMTVSITINPGPGQDPATIARAVRRELDRIERERRAAARSAYRDEDDG
jgi:hypothetical protein